MKYFVMGYLAGGILCSYVVLGVIKNVYITRESI